MTRYHVLTAAAFATIAAITATPVHAQSYRHSHHETLSIINEPYLKFGVGHSVAQIINVPAPVGVIEQAAAAEADARWEDFCKPTRNVDRYNVTRLSYAHEGCEFGRDH